jgi:hypothetical protein
MKKEFKMVGELKWKTEEQQYKDLAKIIKEHKSGWSKDGYVISAEGKFVYRKVAFFIKVLRYYNHEEKFKPIGSNRISEYHAVVEYPDETKPLVDLIPSDFSSEFLYHDTLHSWNDTQSIEVQIKVCEDWAKKDIDNLLEGEISKRIEEEIKRFRAIKKKIENKVRELKK